MSLLVKSPLQIWDENTHEALQINVNRGDPGGQIMMNPAQEITIYRLAMPKQDERSTHISNGFKTWRILELCRAMRWRRRSAEGWTRTFHSMFCSALLPTR